MKIVGHAVRERRFRPNDDKIHFASLSKRHDSRDIADRHRNVFAELGRPSVAWGDQ